MEAKEKTFETKALYEQAVKVWGAESQINMAIEEMAELTKAFLKFRRCFDDGDRVVAYENILEEITDVKIMIEQMEQIFGGNSVRLKQFRQQKLNRLEGLLSGS